MSALDWGRGVRTRVPLSQVPPAVLARVRVRDGEGCALCKRLGLVPPADEPLELDHCRPLADGGDNHWSNLQWLCRSHNRARGRRAPLLDQLPAWLLRLSRERRLEAHVASCGVAWDPKPDRLRRRVAALLGRGAL